MIARESAKAISSLWIQNGRDVASQLLKQKSFWRQEKERCDKQKKPLIHMN
ncbi:hypothetical protein RMSM_01450 [Rhodopirellula maiorica SM1]|uniref:Uncharacterized protein n=1 Tax=Rhodopirellula maiorica SM1 TaxID=1265738 RepID=M5RQK7_9BACT|nr:hypothetical protein RMSM_01450 [Rhodopirellula maiorica SM1]